jgi:hypothetical protein
MYPKSTFVDKGITAMKRIAASLNRLFQIFGRLVEATIGSNGTGRALLASSAPVSLDHRSSRRHR